VKLKLLSMQPESRQGEKMEEKWTRREARSTSSTLASGMAWVLRCVDGSVLSQKLTALPEANAEGHR
jgi:hypothetical protein